jgi:hypothetical protein
VKIVRKLELLFPEAMPWLIWHLNPKRSKSYFRACVLDKARFDRMSKSTNAQENLGRQFLHIFGEKMTLNEALKNLFQFMCNFEMSHKATLKGLSQKYGEWPRTVEPNIRKRKKHVNDGRAPDTSETLKRQDLPKRKIVKTLLMC